MEKKTETMEKLAERTPDCVTELRKGNKVITARGFLRLEGKETALDKMERVILTEGKASGY